MYKTDTPSFRFWIFSAIEHITNGNAVLSRGLYCTVQTINNMTSKKNPYLSNTTTNFQSHILSGDSVHSISTISEEARFVDVNVGR
jgi:hypothetical protein